MKIPVNIISGFLGSGKTTAILRLLNEKTTDGQWAVVINEFGKISIDGQTLRSSTEAGNIFEVSGGCICCSAKGYFHENLKKILSRGIYSRIIIEPSGIGGIDMVSEIVKANPQLTLMPVICLVDLMMIENSKLQRLPIYINQISKADLIVFTKSDLLTGNSEKDRLIDKFKTIFPHKQSSLVVQTNISLALLIKMEVKLTPEIDAYGGMMYANPGLSEENYQQKYCKFDAETIFDAAKLRGFLSNHSKIIRAKGHILTSDGWMLLNFTLTGCNFESCAEKKFSELVIISDEKADFGQNFNSEILSTVTAD